MRRKNENRSTLSPADSQPGVGHEPLAKKKTPRFDGPARVHFHSIRRRLTDADGAFSKYVLDSITDCGVFPDDSPTYIQEVSHTQEKTKGREETIITISVIREAL